MALKLRQVTVTGYKGKEKVELEGVLGQWLKLVNLYSLQHQDVNDACYWYNERATLGILAAAAWQNKGWCALEEYSNNKRDKLGEQKTGRCDLYIRGITSSYACEAKQAWQPMGNKVKTPNGYLLKMLKKAEDAARELDVSEADKRLALCFCVPSFPLSLIGKEQNQTGASTKIIQDWLIELEKIESVALAYIFPEENRLTTLEGGNRIFPGVVLLIREIKKGYGKSQK